MSTAVSVPYAYAHFFPRAIIVPQCQRGGVLAARAASTSDFRVLVVSSKAPDARANEGAEMFQLEVSTPVERQLPAW